ncbi:hypothetical protein OH77DRAFT_1432545 [Trametes cingulata]|nr:hypothetical protein OH77DRAFT_1432545 [Trametes cingulata]
MAAAALLVAPSSGGHWAMAHVEQLLGPFSGSFTATFIPKLILLIGNCANGPWRLFGLDLVSAMADLAKEVWPMLTVEILPRRPFYEVAKQKLSEYRNAIGNQAIEVVGAYMQSARFSTMDDRAEYVSWALSEAAGYPFRYERVSSPDSDGKVTKTGIYQSKIIARTFAYHLRRIGLRSEQLRDWPCNALALVTTAVERALKMWDGGSFKRPKPRSEEAKFSERLWGKTASEEV